MNRKIEKQIRKKGKKKRFYLSIFAFIMLLFVPVFVYASEMKSDGKTTQVIEEENKTVRVGYFPYSNFQEGSYGEHKQGAGYEYLQKISYITGWKYEYVYGSFKECLDMLADGKIDILGIHQKERNLSIFQPTLRGQKNIGSIPGKIIRILRMVI